MRFIPAGFAPDTVADIDATLDIIVAIQHVRILWAIESSSRA